MLNTHTSVYNTKEEEEEEEEEEKEFRLSQDCLAFL